MDTSFHNQADLLISVLPYIAMEPDMALHGGTAINFFVRNMPRLSIDADLTYLPVTPRKEALTEISGSLIRISTRIFSRFPRIQIEQKTDEAGFVTKLIIRYHNAVIKIEPNFIIRGTLFGPEERSICKKAEETFEKHVTIKTMSFSELYGSKICAALDRQHPRDIFDIMLLLENEGIDDNIKKAFLVYLLSHNRPIAELLAPNMQDFRGVFEKEFAGMTDREVSYSKLTNVRQDLVDGIHSQLNDQDRNFLLSFKQGAPDWDLLGMPAAPDMPAVMWKLQNIEQMNRKKNIEAVEKLKKCLNYKSSLLQNRLTLCLFRCLKTGILIVAYQG